MASTDEPIVDVRGLVKRFGSTVALDGLDLAVPAGSVFGLLGPNGAGKTTAVRVLATLVRPDAGQVRVAGHDALAQPERVREVIGLTGQYAAIDGFQSGRANLVMLGRLSGLSHRRAKTRAADLLHRFDLADAADRAAGGYSGGMRRRLDLAASLVTTPRVLFLDEPTTGLDPASRLGLWETVTDVVAQGTTVLLTTQYLEEADHLAHKIAVIDHGRVVAEGTPSELKTAVGATELVVTIAPDSDLSAAADLLDATGFATRPIQVDTDGRRLRLLAGERAHIASDLIGALSGAGIHVDLLSAQEPSLDQVFLILTGHAATTGPATDTATAPASRRVSA
ncbi:ATP-binding cassette domain-containing protein [Streptomyces sp. NPDC059906]|uniref:ATP-binding cassette domain-containing protein n=1 Tax=Streptomyces sp. NPDC059906 TaxID=3346997 RepID=UPI003646F1DA